jgi:hypothetical protein
MSRAGTTRPPRRLLRTEWSALTLAGAAAFWSANLVISLTPAAAEYRSALSIRYVSMLVEAALGGLIVSGVVALAFVQLTARRPGRSAVRTALVLAVCALVVVTVLVEVPAKLGAGLDEPTRWLFVATVFNTIRVLALGLAIGLTARAREARTDNHRFAADTGRKP